MWFQVSYHRTQLGNKRTAEEPSLMISFLPYLDLFWFHTHFLCIDRRSWPLETSRWTVLRLGSSLPDGDGGGDDGDGEEFRFRSTWPLPGTVVSAPRGLIHLVLVTTVGLEG